MQAILHLPSQFSSETASFFVFCTLFSAKITHICLFFHCINENFMLFYKKRLFRFSPLLLGFFLLKMRACRIQPH